MRSWTGGSLLLALILVGSAEARAQVAGEALLDSLATHAPSRPLAASIGDSGVAFIAFRDTSMTREYLADSTYMFGPYVSPEEAAGCAPPRFNARKVARQYYRLAGRHHGVQRVTVMIGSSRVQASYFFYLDELAAPGDSTPVRRGI